MSGGICFRRDMFSACLYFALVYILLTRLSDLTAPLPWTHHTSAKGFVVLQKQVLLHTNSQRVETLRAISLLLKAFSGGPSLPKVSLQRCCTPPPVVTVARPHYPLPLDTCSNWLCPPSHPIPSHSTLY